MKPYYDSTHKRMRIKTDEGKQTTYARFLLERKLGRKLLSSEDAHHIDGNKQNDSEDNLKALDRYSHIEDQLKKGTLFGGYVGGAFKRRTCGDDSKAWCSRCKQFLPKANFSSKKEKWNGVTGYCKDCFRQYWRDRRASTKLNKELK